MDILTQGVIGAALPLATRHKKQAATAAALGFLAGLAPDLDALIRSSEDSLMFLEFHRHQILLCECECYPYTNSRSTFCVLGAVD